MDAKRLLDALNRLGRPRVLVVGDLMIDRYTWGNIERISQEAPVMVLRVDREDSRMGGAANVAAMLHGLEAEVACAGVVGRDDAASDLMQQFADQQITYEGVVTDVDRPTTVKQRFVGRAAHRHPNQILRVDREDCQPLTDTVQRQLLAYLETAVAQHDVVLVSDYGKGVCTTTLLRSLIQICRKAQVPVLVDPVRGRDHRRYAGATLIKPNRVETELVSGQVIEDSETALRAGRDLCAQLDVDYAVVTLDRDGMVLVDRQGTGNWFPTRPRAVYDITGAGDVVLAMLGICWGSRIQPGEAVALSNVAGGIEVEQAGVCPVYRHQIHGELRMESTQQAPKQMTLNEAAAACRQMQADGQRIVLTNGCFDLLHVGHVTYLQQAASMGDRLVVAVNSDASVRRLKGPSRPVISEDNRAAMLAALEAVDMVIVFDEDTPHTVLETVRPDVLVKGGTYSVDEVVGKEVVEGYGGQVQVLGVVDGVSTSDIVESISHRQAG